MSVTIPARNLATLAGRLTETNDRETYAALVSYLNSLPPGDELVKMAELFGLLSLLGERVPAALADAMTELRELATTTSDYHDKVDQRLANLPAEIKEGVDLAAIGEAFRQQVANTGLENSAAILRASSKEITALSDQVSKTLKPISQEYKTISGTLAGEITKLTTASAELRNQNARLMLEQHSASWWWLATAALLIFLLGGISGMFLDKQQTAEALSSMTLQLERHQTPAPVTAAVMPPKKSKKQRGTVQ